MAIGDDIYRSTERGGDKLKFGNTAATDFATFHVKSKRGFSVI
jgi:hypothetical protein